MHNNETALDRLERTKLPSTEREFTLEEQMESVSTDDFLDGMSEVAKNNLGHLFQEVTTDSYSNPSNNDELFNNNNKDNKPKRAYRKNSKQSITNNTNSESITDISNPVLDQLAKDLLDDLKSRKYKINRFDEKSMEMIFNYMYNKF